MTKKPMTTKTDSPEETRRFQMHSKLLFDVILRQAGSLAKACLELVMNSVDAKATACDITLSEGRVVVADNGVGFRNRKEIETWFECFGQPHEESENKTYGRFRIGRGQGFAYGVNVWTTNEFQMTVDVKSKGLDYKLSKADKPHKGCSISIELYDKLKPSDLQDTEISLRRWCRWVPITVTLNGEEISHPANETEWDEETDDAYIALDDSAQLRVYNQGIFVVEFSKSAWGTGGEVVSKKEIRVNFARNEIQSDCPVWRKIKPLIDQRGREKTQKKHTLDDLERLSFLRRIKRGDIRYEEWRDLKLFTAVTGRHYELRFVGDHKYQLRISVAKQGSVLGDNLHRQKSAFILSQKTLDGLGFTIEQFVAWIAGIENVGWLRPPTYVPFARLTAGMDDKHVILREEDLTVTEKIWKDLICVASGEQRIGSGDGSYHDRGGYLDRLARVRKICIGVGVADGWTDAATYIAISRKYLAARDVNINGLIDIAHLVLHELCHMSPDTGDHDHDQTFYEEYHDASTDFVCSFVHRGLSNMSLILRRHKKKLSKGELHALDRAAAADKAVEDVSKLAARRGPGDD